MVNFLILNLLVIGFLVFVILSTVYKPDLASIPLISSKTSPSKLKLAIASIIGSILVFFAFYLDSSVFLSYYIRVMFSILALLGGCWVAYRHKSDSLKTLIFSCFFIIAISRFVYPNTLTHNLFLYAATFWVASFFVATRVIYKKRFILLSLLWVVYDVIFVWLTNASEHALVKTDAVGFPLGLVYKTSFIGSGDLIWASFLLAVLGSVSKRIFVSIILIIVNILVGYISFYILDVKSIPLLVFWVPVGLLLLLILDKRVK